MSEITGLLQTLEPGHWLMAAGGALILFGVAGLLIRAAETPQRGPPPSPSMPPAEKQ